MDWEKTALKKRKWLLILSVLVMLQALYYDGRDITEVCDRNAKKAVSEEETYVSSKLPPGTKVVHVGTRSGSIYRENHELIGGVIVRTVLAGGFLGWCIYKYREEKQATELEEQRKRKLKEMETNLMLYKEKRLKEQAEKYGVVEESHEESEEC